MCANGKAGIMSHNGGSGNNELPRELRELSEKLIQVHEATEKRQKAKNRSRLMWRRYQFALYASVIVAIIVESLIGLYFSSIPGSDGDGLWVPGTIGFIMLAALLSLVVLAGLLIEAPKQLATHVHCRSLRGRVRGVVLSTDTVQVTLPSGREGSLSEISYVYEVSDVRHTGCYRPRNTVNKVSRRLNRTRALFPPGKVIEVYYDLENPASSSLKRGPGGVAAIGLALAFLAATWLVSAGISLLFIPFAPFAAFLLGAVMLFGASKQYHQFQGIH